MSSWKSETSCHSGKHKKKKTLVDQHCVDADLVLLKMND